MTNNPTIDGVSRAKIHHLKIHAKPFEDLVSGRKTSEVRNCADREFREGDHVELFLIDETGNPANKSIVRTITHIQRGYGLPDDICVLSYAGIDAPAVERQEPVAEVVATGGPHDREDRVLVELQAELPPVGTKIYAAPPEVAALQSTIARLEARITQLESEKELLLRAAKVLRGRVSELKSEEPEWAAMQQRLGDENAQLRDRIAELESGRGEPVAVMYADGSVLTKAECGTAFEICCKVETPLFTAPPAPVAVVKFANELIDGAFEGGNFGGDDIQDIAVKHGLLSIETRDEPCGEFCACKEYGFPAECHRKTACLDATAALNEERK